MEHGQLSFGLETPPEPSLRVSHICSILQGEGVNQGIPMLMCRLQGCPQKCLWCDTIYAQDPKGGTEYSVSQLIEAIRQSRFSWVCLSGGEPLLQQSLIGQVIRVTRLNWEVETSGFFPPPDWFDKVQTWVVDHKCPSSGTESKSIGEWVKILAPLYPNSHAIKFVVKDETDLQFALEHRVSVVDNILSPCIWDIRIFLGQIVIGREQAEWNRRVAAFALEHKFRLSIQAHKLLWGQERQDV